jgi:hypothetical protein
MADFDPYAGTQATLTGTTIPATKDQAIVQNRSGNLKDALPGKTGVLVFDWSYDSENDNWDSSDELPAATYTTQFKIPKGAILTEVPIINTWEAKAGSGTITPTLGATACTAIATAGVNVESTAHGTFKAGYEATSDVALTVVVASNTITAGGFTMYLPYRVGDQWTSQLEERNPQP